MNISVTPRPKKAYAKEGSAATDGKFCVNCGEEYSEVKRVFGEGLEKIGFRMADDAFPVTITTNTAVDKEGYILDIASDGIAIDAADKGGALYALETLRQLLYADGATLSCARIEDAPAVRHRGFMLDVGRYFYTVSEVKKFVDLMTIHKLNVLHLHLTEDQGWRVEIKKFPKLTEVGSRRSHTNFNIVPHKGFYTREDIEDIVSYCRARNITVIPEIDMPGHMQAAIASYPELGCFGRKLPVATHWGVKHDILCAGKDFTYEFVYGVLDEICEMFPDGYIHLGGDEAPKMRWELCPDCQRKMKEEGIESEDSLQTYFIEKVRKYLAQKGFETITWNENDLKGESHIETIWEIWNVSGAEGEKRLVEEMKRGRKMINGRSGPFYLDLTYYKNSLEKVYNTSSYYSEECRENTLGAEASLWTELVPNFENAMFKTLPRLSAFAENVWTPDSEKSYSDFTGRYGRYEEYLAAHGFRGGASVKRANIAGLGGKLEQLWFNRCQLMWHGLHNLVDDAKVKRLAKKYVNKNTSK